MLFVSSVYFNTSNTPIIILAGCGNSRACSFIKVFGGTSHARFVKARIFKKSWTTSGYVDLLSADNITPPDTTIATSFGLGIEARIPTVVPEGTLGDRGFSIEVEWGGVETT